MGNPAPTPKLVTLTPDQVVKELRHLPSAPKVLPPLKRLLSDGNSSMTEIIELIRLDPAISARVLQTANSAYYGFGARCLHLDDAVNRVGYDRIYDLVGYTVASQVLVRPLESYGIESDHIWLSSVACALAAELLAEQMGEDREVAYTVGLLHGIGMLVIDDWTLRNQPGVRLVNRGFPNEACESERKLLGFNQAEAGAALLRHWDFPITMSEPVRWQHFPRSTAGHQRMSCLLHAAKWIRSTLCAATPGESPPKLDPWLLQPLSLESQQLEQCVDEVKSELTKINSLLDSGSRKMDRIDFPGGSREFDPAAVRPA